jgi:hypothetical protein
MKHLSHLVRVLAVTVCACVNDAQKAIASFWAGSRKTARPLRGGEGAGPRRQGGKPTGLRW